jgi:hypothetical protein
VDIVVVEIQEDVVYFKCKKPMQYVAQKCENYGFGYSYYTKGTVSLVR